MTKLTLRASLLSLSLFLLAVPASAGAKASSAEYKKVAKQVNSTHKKWVAARGPAINEARKAGAEVAEKCLPAFEAAGRLEEDSAVPAELATAYWAMKSGASTEITKPLRDEMADSLSSLGSRDSGAMWWLTGTIGIKGIYMTPDEVCQDANTWQAKGFAESYTPRSTDRVMGNFWLYATSMEGRQVTRLVKKLRQHGARRVALRSFQYGYVVDDPGADRELAMKALFPDQPPVDPPQKLEP